MGKKCQRQNKQTRWRAANAEVLQVRLEDRAASLNRNFAKLAANTIISFFLSEMILAKLLFTITMLLRGTENNKITYFDVS